MKIYIILCAIAFIWLEANLGIANKDDEEIEDNSMIRFIILSIMSITWFISIPVFLMRSE